MELEELGRGEVFFFFVFCVFCSCVLCFFCASRNVGSFKSFVGWFSYGVRCLRAVGFSGFLQRC